MSSKSSKKFGGMNRDILLCAAVVIVCGLLLWLTRTPVAALAGLGLAGSRRRRFA